MMNLFEYQAKYLLQSVSLSLVYDDNMTKKQAAIYSQATFSAARLMPSFMPTTPCIKMPR